MLTELNAYVMNDYANITQITLLVRRLDIGTKVIRVRQHSQENQLFKYRKDLSYPPKEKVKLARANMDGQPMFYGAVFSNFCINDNPRLTCLLETNKEVLDDTFVGKKDLTYSLWLNKREINLFVIPVFDSYPHPAKDFEWYYELWKELMQDDRINKEQINVLKELSRHFSLTGEKKEEENSYACSKPSSLTRTFGDLSAFSISANTFLASLLDNTPPLIRATISPRFSGLIGKASISMPSLLR